MVTMFEHEYEIGETVYLKTDLEKKPRIVVAIVKYQSDYMYKLVYDDLQGDHYEFEISKEPLLV